MENILFSEKMEPDLINGRNMVEKNTTSIKMVFACQVGGQLGPELTILKKMGLLLPV